MLELKVMNERGCSGAQLVKATPTAGARLVRVAAGTE